MKGTLSKPKMIAGITTTFFAAALIMLLFISNANKGLKNNLSSEKISSEKLLAEKLALEKEIAQYNKEIEQFNTDLEMLKGKNNELDNLLTDAKKTLSQKQEELSRIVKANAGKKAIEKELAELKKMKDNYENQISELNYKIKALSAENNELSEENNSLNQKIASLETQNKELSTDNQLLKLMVADDYLVEGLKGKKDKLTLNARRTNKIVFSFDVRDDIDPNLEFSITTPDGKMIERNDKNITTTILNAEQNVSDNSGETATDGNGIKINKRIKMEYNPKEKFKKGVYKIEIYNNNKYLSSFQVRLN